MSDEKKKILIADSSTTIALGIETALKKKGCSVRKAFDGYECLRLVKSFSPQLIFLDLIAAKMHGIEILKKLKSDPETKDIGVIISTHSAMSQDYEAAISNGADYYLIKPFHIDTVTELVDSFFSGNLQPAPFVAPGAELTAPEDTYQPTALASKSFIRFWGTRGSIPVAGLDYYRYGGNTSCLEVRDDKNVIIIDAGTGIRPLGNELLELGTKDIHLFIGHTHWDHIIGFPFFAPVYMPDYNIHIYAARGFHKSIEELFTGMLDHDFFPVRLEDMQANFVFHDLVDHKPIQIGDIAIHYEYASHPGATLCFRIDSKTRKVGYATDNEFLSGYHGHPADTEKYANLLSQYDSIIEFFKGCDIVIHEAQYTPEEYREKVGWGHSSIANAAILMKQTKAKEWVITHHDPADNDQSLLSKLQLHRQILKDANVDCRLFMAYDGLTLPIS